MARLDYDEQSKVYDRGRGLPDEAVTAWMVAARRHIGDDVGCILDLGSGTGQWSAPLADTLDADVIGVEPSAGMRGRAAGKRHPRVRIVGGKAERIPLLDNTCDAAWLSAVIHHFDDLDTAAEQLRRVVSLGGPVLIRGAFPGRGPIGSIDRFFPGTQRELESYPSVPETFAAFERAGFSTFYVEKVEQVTAHSLAEVVERVRLRADSVLQALLDTEFEEGLRDLEATAHDEHGSVRDALDLVVMR